jgi:hypothetical protein
MACLVQPKRRGEKVRAGIFKEGRGEEVWGGIFKKGRRSKI